MSKKTLSTGTLSLRFMQNAHRAKNIAHIELEQAEVQDDGKWEVSDEIKQAWGLQVVPRQTVTYEASYLPFIFPAEEDRPNLKGRRSFKGGKEVVEQTPPSAVIVQVAEDEITQAGDNEAGPSSGSRRPTSISSVPLPRHSKPKSTKSARDLVYSNSDVGTEFRSGRRDRGSHPKDSDVTLIQDEKLADRLSPSAKVPPPNGLPVFLKPFGVDEPPRVKHPSASADLVTKNTSKRERESVSDGSQLERKKRKKKRKQE